MPTTADPARSTVDLKSDLHQALREDEADVSAVRSRGQETALSYEDFLAKLKAEGTL